MAATCFGLRPSSQYTRHTGTCCHTTE